LHEITSCWAEICSKQIHVCLSLKHQLFPTLLEKLSTNSSLTLPMRENTV